MPDDTSTLLLAQLCASLASADAELALEQALAALKHLGMDALAPTLPDTPGRREPAWLTLSHGPRTLTLSAPRSGLGADLREWVAALLQALLVRAAEHDELRKVRERMQLLSAASFEGLFFHVDGTVVDVNQRLAELTGYESHELLGDLTLQRTVAVEDLPEVMQRMTTGYEGEYVVTAIRKDGTRFRAALQTKQGKVGDRPVRVAAVRDVSERERTQALLRESEMRLRDLAEATFDLTVFSRDGVVVDVAGPLEDILGYTREQFVGHHILEFVAQASAQEIGAVLADQRTGAYRTVAKAKNGESFPMEVVAVLTTLHGEPVRMSALRDLREAERLVDERRKLEQAFERSQRLDSLGVLAGGIAHDFNNLLMAVLGNAELLLRREPDPALRNLAQGILEAGKRAASLTAQMLTYAGRKELGPRAAVDLGELLRELHSLLDATLSKKARLSLEVGERCTVLGNRATLTQVLMNLLTNASDALGEEQGTISVRVQRLSEPDARWAHALGARIVAGSYVQIEVGDTGMGMDEATQARVFEPFFSTKIKGHGLGLAACIGIVSSHGGAILVDSTLGRGSTFSVLLPAHDAPPAPVSKAPAQVSATGARVLVVDDEDLVRAHLCRVLQEWGYVVSEASCGHAALRALDDAKHDVILLDVMMPDLSGIEVLQRIRAQGNDVPVLLSSGYHDAALTLDPSTFQGFLVKPYMLDVLFEAVQRAVAAYAEARKGNV